MSSSDEMKLKPTHYTKMHYVGGKSLNIERSHCGYMVWQHYAVVLVVPSSTQRWLAFLLRRRTMLESISAAVFLSFTSSFSLLLASFRRVRLHHVSSSDSFKMPLACKHGEGKAGEWMLSKHLTTAIISMDCIHYYIASFIGAGKVSVKCS